MSLAREVHLKYHCPVMIPKIKSIQPEICPLKNYGSPTNCSFLKPKNCCDIVKKIRYPQVEPKLVYLNVSQLNSELEYWISKSLADNLQAKIVEHHNTVPKWNNYILSYLNYSHSILSLCQIGMEDRTAQFPENFPR